MSKNVIGMQKIGNVEILASGPLTKQPGTLAYRWVVLRDRNDGTHTLHRQTFEESAEELQKMRNLPQGSFSSGQYLAAGKGGFLKAISALAERLSSPMELEHMQSAFRGE